MDKEKTLTEKIVEEKQKLRTQKIGNTICITITIILSLWFITSTISYISTEPKFESETILVKDNMILYNDQLYPEKLYKNYQTKENNFYFSLISEAIIGLPLLLITIYTSSEIKKQKDVIQNLEHEHQKEIKEENTHLENEIKNTKINNEEKKYCQYCGTILHGDICLSCGAKLHKE